MSHSNPFFRALGTGTAVGLGAGMAIAVLTGATTRGDFAGLVALELLFYSTVIGAAAGVLFRTRASRRPAWVAVPGALVGAAFAVAIDAALHGPSARRFGNRFDIYDALLLLSGAIPATLLAVFPPSQLPDAPRGLRRVRS